jgi:hypothetical protein
MKRVAALLFALLLVPIGFAYHDDDSGRFDLDYSKDYEYVRVKENERSSSRYDDYDSSYGYYPRYGHARNSFDYARSREFEFGRYREDLRVRGDFADRSYNYYSYPGYDGYDDYSRYRYDYYDGYDDYGGRYGYSRYPIYGCYYC